MGRGQARGEPRQARRGFRRDPLLDWTAAVIRADRRFDYGEVRLEALAPIGPRIHSVIYTIETRSVRIISLRRANPKEIALYEAEIRGSHP